MLVLGIYIVLQSRDFLDAVECYSSHDVRISSSLIFFRCGFVFLQAYAVCCCIVVVSAFNPHIGICEVVDESLVLCLDIYCSGGVFLSYDEG